MADNEFPCPYLGGNVELSDEREAHITERHPDLLPVYRDLIRDTLAKPDEVRRSERLGNSRMFSRYYADVLEGKHIVVIVVSEVAPDRHWIATSYIARRLSGGIPEWKRN
jgi:hypothetical protein